ncbi:tetratricopeptide repeat protein [Parvibaculum lavamentivorans]|nr:tetratricopeptide repeat protein [Parvibaculum lavamentivorans]
MAALLAALAFMAPAALRADAIDDNNFCYAQFATGNNEAAIGYCTKAIDSGELSEPDLISALINRGVAYKNVGNLEAAIADYTAALRIAPRDALVYRNRANALREMGDYDAATADIEQSISLDPQSAAAWYVRGAIMEAREDKVSARKFYMTALGLEPDNEAYKDKILGLDAE